MVQHAFELEEQILLFVQDHMRNAALTPVMKGITMLGDMGAVWILISIGLCLSKRWRKTGVTGMCAVGLSVMVNNVFLKNLIGRPEHTFYVDNLFAYQPLPYVKKIRYLSVDFYQYFIGRDDQSVNEQVMMRRIDQQIKVTELVAESVDLDEVRKVHPKLANYMRRNISIMLAISSIHLLLIHTDEALKKRKKMWETIRKLNGPLYYRLRFGTLSGFTYLPGPIGAKLTVSGYGLAKKIYQFQ